MPSFTSINETRTYSDVAQSVLIAKGVLSDLQIIVGESSVLHKIFQDSIKVAALWEGGKENLDFRMALNLLYADIICSAIINLKDDPGVRTPLIHMAKSDMARGSRALSRGKDALWELALADSMRKAAIKARLIDPPDIIADMSFGPYSIACKKVYSDKNVDTQLKKGVRQVLESVGKGIVAFNLDDLTPGDTILSQADAETSLRRLSRFNDEFIERHRWVFQGAVSAKKIDGILVSTTVPADIHTDARRLNNVTQYTFWTLKGESKGSQRIKEFVQILAGNRR